MLFNSPPDLLLGSEMLEVRSVSHKYASKFALQSVSFTLGGSGVVGLLGANGAGKSTLMNIVSGCLSQTSGQVSLGGFDVKKQPKSARSQIGYLPQQAPLSFELTIREFLTFSAVLRGVRKAAICEAVGEAMFVCELESMRDRTIGNLSGGYRQRVGIAQAIIHKPKLVILDEPTVGLDPKQVMDVRRLIERIGTERAVLISTHILPDVEALCSDVLIIENGRLVFDGGIEDVDDIFGPPSIIFSCDMLPDLSRLPKHFVWVESIEQIDDHSIRILRNDNPVEIDELIKLAVAEDWGVEEIYYEKPKLEMLFSRS